MHHRPPDDITPDSNADLRKDLPHSHAADASPHRAHGRVVLIAEDRAVLAMLLADALHENGYVVAGPAATYPHACELASSRSLCAALLDVDLDGVRVYPLARDLQKRSVPTLLLTGYNLDDIPQDLRGTPLLPKPVAVEDILRFLASAC